jgi:hypothetical protein
MTLEDFFKQETAGCQDFRLRATSWNGRVQIYIYPLGKDGGTTPTLDVVGNSVRMAEGSSAPGWERD